MRTVWFFDSSKEQLYVSSFFKKTHQVQSNETNSGSRTIKSQPRVNRKSTISHPQVNICDWKSVARVYLQILYTKIQIQTVYVSAYQIYLQEKQGWRQELQTQSKKIETQSKQIEKLMGKLEIHGSFNTTNNIQNINLLAYRETDVSHLTDQDYRSCIKRVNYCVKNMIERVHFNPSKPENMNIYISNIKDKYIMVYDGSNWNLANKKEEIDRLYEEKEMMLEEWLESNPEKELKDKFMRYLNNKESDECLNRIKEEIRLMLYNNQKMLE